ncbi:hypothetical protein K1X84_01960 [bacterium]|nr:hypothetical protein [bacterium]
MLEKLVRRIIPQVIGLGMMVIGWYLSVLSVGLDRFTGSIFTKWTLIGLFLILIGGYIPQIWIAVLHKMNK